MSVSDIPKDIQEEDRLSELQDRKETHLIDSIGDRDEVRICAGIGVDGRGGREEVVLVLPPLLGGIPGARAALQVLLGKLVGRLALADVTLDVVSHLKHASSW